MSKLKIFLATPISGFSDVNKYRNYRDKVLLLINILSDQYEIYSEIQSISGDEMYDTPQESVKKDFCAIREADVFILLHPIKTQTSTLIELGYACALKKSLIIVGSEKILPYMVLGLTEKDHNAITILSSEIDHKTITKIKNVLDTLKR